jgi:hypothetical protein
MMSFGTKQCRLMAVPANGRVLYRFARDRDSLPELDHNTRIGSLRKTYASISQKAAART